MPSKHRERVFAYVKQDRFIMDSCEDLTPWVFSTDSANEALSVNHREGSSSISMDKDGVTQDFITMTKTYDTDKQLDIVDFLRGKLRFWINLSDLTNVASVQIFIGDSASHNAYYTILDTALTTGWNEVTFDIDSPSGVTGNGAAWGSIGYIQIKVNFDAVGNQLANILVDAISTIYEIDTNIENVNLSSTGLATSALQTSGNASLTTIAAKDFATSAKQDTGNGSLATIVTNTGNIAGTVVAEDATLGANGLQQIVEARTTQKTAMTAEGDGVTPVATLYGEAIMAGYNYTNQNNRVEETDPISTHHIEDTVAAITNGVNGTYSYYLDMDDFSKLGLQLVLTGTLTVTIEGTLQDDGTAPSSCTYIDVTSTGFGSASFSASAILNDKDGYFGQFKYVKIKVVAAGGGTDDWTIYSKRKY